MDITTHRFDNYYHHPTPAPLRPVLRLCSSNGRHIPIDVSIHMSIIIPSSYAVLCSSDAFQLSSLHQPCIHPRSISDWCFFSPIFLLAILKVVLLVSSSGQLHHLYSPWIILSWLTSSDVHYPLCVLLIILSGLTSVQMISSPPFLLDFAGTDVDVGPAVPSDVDRCPAGGLL